MEKFEDLQSDFWDLFDFSNGRIVYSEIMIDEDMLLVEYPNKLILDVGFYSDAFFRVQIIWDYNWQLPVAVYTCKKADNLSKIVNIALRQVKKETENPRLSYYGNLWETIYLDIDN